MPLTAEVWTNKIRTCAAVVICMLIQLGSLRSSIAILLGLMGPRAKAEKKTLRNNKRCLPQAQGAGRAVLLMDAQPETATEMGRERKGEGERRRGERCSVYLRKREKEKGGVRRERAIVVHKHTCRHRKKPKDGEEKRISCTAHTQPGIQIQDTAHAHHSLWKHTSPTLQNLTNETSRKCCLFVQWYVKRPKQDKDWKVFFFAVLLLVYFQSMWKSRSGNLKSLTGARCNPPPCDQDSSSWFPILMNNLVRDKIWQQMPAAVFL